MMTSNFLCVCSRNDSSRSLSQYVDGVLRPAGHGDGVAATGGTRITANSTWLKHELDREGLGALLHEEVHVLQQYRRPRRDNSDTPRARAPG